MAIKFEEIGAERPKKAGNADAAEVRPASVHTEVPSKPPGLTPPLTEKPKRKAR